MYYAFFSRKQENKTSTACYSISSSCSWFPEYEERNRNPSVENRENTFSEYAINYCYLMRKPLVCKHKCHIHFKSLLCQLTGTFQCGKTTETTTCNLKHAFSLTMESKRSNLKKMCFSPNEFRNVFYKCLFKALYAHHSQLKMSPSISVNVLVSNSELRLWLKHSFKCHEIGFISSNFKTINSVAVVYFSPTLFN